MKYKVTFNAGQDNQQARDKFSDYISAVRDGLEIVVDFLGIYPEYETGHIEFEVNVTDNLLELPKDKHFKFLNRLQVALYEYKNLFICELID